MPHRVKPLVLIALSLVTILCSRVCWGVVALGDDAEIEGFVQAQNILRTPKFQGAELIMQRNTAQVEGKWYFLRDGVALGRFATGWLEEATLSVIGRGVYDSIYDIRDSFRDRFSTRERENRKFDYNLREVYGDFIVPPLTLRLGRQQVVWGETDQFRALDVINPLDFRWHWTRENWEDIRIPAWMARAIYDLGKLGPVEESFLEGIWIPGDFERNQIATDGRRPWGFFGSGLRRSSNTAILGGNVFDLVTLVRDRKPDWALESSELALRFKAIWGGVDFGLNYFWTLSDDTGLKTRRDLADVSLVALRPDAAGTLTLPVDLVNPRGHVIGFSANYSEERLTQTVFRVEGAYKTGVPVHLREGVAAGLDADGNGYQATERAVVMLAFDRPTWLRPLNEMRTVFLTGQFFWQRYTDYNRFFRGAFSVRRAVLDGRVLEDRFVDVNTDRLTEDEFVITLAASTSYGAAGLWNPLVSVAYDPIATAGYNRVSVEYLYSAHLVFRLTQDFYWGKSYEGPWFIGERFGRSRDSRQETILTVIFQF